MRKQKLEREPFIVVITEMQDVHAMKNAYALGAGSFLTKPVTAADVKNLTERYPEY